MQPSSFAKIIAAFASALLMTSGAQAQSGERYVADRMIPLGDAADAPSGFVEMCERDRQLCMVGEAPVARTVAVSARVDPPATLEMAPAFGLSAQPWRANDCARRPALRPASTFFFTDAGPLAAPVSGFSYRSMFASAWGQQGGLMQSALTHCDAGFAAMPSQGAVAWQDMLRPASLFFVEPAPAIATTPPADVEPAPRFDNKAARKLLAQVNNLTNRRVMQRSDLQTTGMSEYWAAPSQGRGAAGDCEDFAIAKRLELEKAGFDPERLFYAVVYRPNLAVHVVLVARLDDGDVVLDSLSSKILPWTQTPYTFVRVQTPGDPTRWARLRAPTGYQRADATDKDGKALHS